jgi:hypothetical protein
MLLRLIEWNCLESESEQNLVFSTLEGFKNGAGALLFSLRLLKRNFIF